MTSFLLEKLCENGGFTVSTHDIRCETDDSFGSNWSVRYDEAESDWQLVITQIKAKEMEAKDRFCLYYFFVWFCI